MPFLWRHIHIDLKVSIERDEETNNIHHPEANVEKGCSGVVWSMLLMLLLLLLLLLSCCTFTASKTDRHDERYTFVHSIRGFACQLRWFFFFFLFLLDVSIWNHKFFTIPDVTFSWYFISITIIILFGVKFDIFFFRPSHVCVCAMQCAGNFGRNSINSVCSTRHNLTGGEPHSPKEPSIRIDSYNWQVVNRHIQIQTQYWNGIAHTLIHMAAHPYCLINIINFLLCDYCAYVHKLITLLLSAHKIWNIYARIVYSDSGWDLHKYVKHNAQHTHTYMTHEPTKMKCIHRTQKHEHSYTIQTYVIRTDLFHFHTISTAFDAVLYIYYTRTI